jgi:enoyl-CoA hydratase/carnithine racemase
LLVESKEANGVFWIVLNRPEKANAINLDMWRQVLAKLEEGTASTKSSVIAITGTGKYFSAGEDLTDLSKASSFADALNLFLDTMRPVFDKIFRCPKPVIAAINGIAVGAGTELIFACDMAVAIPDATFALAQGRQGIGPALALTIGMLRIGKKQLAELGMTGRRFGAKEAQDWGLINGVAKNGLEAEVERLAREVAQTPPTLIRTMKEVMLREMTILGVESAFTYIAMYSQSEETREGIKRFLSKKS